MPQGRIKVETIIANVVRDLQLSSVNDVIDYMIEWAYEAETAIGSYDTFVRKECELKIENNRIRLPADLYQFVSLKVGGTYPEITFRDFRLFYKDSPNLATNSSGSGLRINGSETRTSKMAMEGGWIHVSGIQQETTAGLAYMAFDLDDKGFPLIKDGHEKAVTAYIMWKYKTAPYVEGTVPHHVYASLERRWYWLCGQARGDDEMPDPKQLEYIASLYHQLLPLASKNFF